MLFPPGSRLAETSKAEDAGLAPKESAIETLCRWAVMADSAKGFRVSIAILLVKLRCGGPWITKRDDAGLLLPGLLIAFAFVIGFLRGPRFWFASCADRT